MKNNSWWFQLAILQPEGYALPVRRYFPYFFLNTKVSWEQSLPKHFLSFAVQFEPDYVLNIWMLNSSVQGHITGLIMIFLFHLPFP